MKLLEMASLGVSEQGNRGTQRKLKRTWLITSEQGNRGTQSKLKRTLEKLSGVRKTQLGEAPCRWELGQQQPKAVVVEPTK